MSSSGVISVVATFVWVWASTAFASAAQDKDAVAAEAPGPPHEQIFRAQEQISAVLCKAPTQVAEEKRLNRKYAARIEAVQKSVAVDFGAVAANAPWVSVLPCTRFVSYSAFRRALNQAERALADELKRWELRYGLHQSPKGS